MAKTTIRVELRKDKIDKSGFCPVRIIYQTKGERKVRQTTLRVRPENWNSNEQKAIYLNTALAKKILPDVDYHLLPTARDVQNFNDKIAALKKQIRGVESHFELNEKNYELAEVIELIKQKEDNLPKAIKSNPKVFIDDFIEQHINANNGIVKPRTLKTYATLLKHLRDYAAQKKERLTFELITYDKLKNLHNYFIKIGLNNTTIAKQFSILKSLIKQAIRLDKKLTVCQDFRDYAVTRKDGDHEVIALEQSEFEAILDLNLNNSKRREIYQKVIKGKTVELSVSHTTLDKARDLFVFACTTGLRYSDVDDLKHEHVRHNIIFKKAVKTGQSLEIPLNSISRFILKKNEGHLNPLPKLSNQKLNDFIKVLGRIAGITTSIEKVREYGAESRSEIKEKWELLSSHTGRKTFVTLSLAMGGMVQDVMSLSGHKKHATFKRYSHVGWAQKEKTINLWDETINLKNSLMRKV